MALIRPSNRRLGFAAAAAVAAAAAAAAAFVCIRCYWHLRSLLLKQKFPKEWAQQLQQQQQQGAAAAAAAAAAEGPVCLVWGEFRVCKCMKKINMKTFCLCLQPNLCLCFYKNIYLVKRIYLLCMHCCCCCCCGFSCNCCCMSRCCCCCWWCCCCSSSAAASISSRWLLFVC